MGFVGSSRPVRQAKMSKERIVRYSADEIRRKIAQSDDKTDWSRIDALTDQQIGEAAKNDPDWMDVADVDWSSAQVVYHVTKSAISIRLDSDVVDFFKSSGKGYQGRMNAVLRHFMTAQRQGKKAG